MATPYTDVYAAFLAKVNEYSFLSMPQANVESTLLNYLKSSVFDFVNPKVDLTIDDVNSQFVNTLNYDEIEVLATWMIYHFLKPKVVSSENYRQMMADSDFKIYSQANQLNAVKQLMKDMKAEAERLNTKYSYKKRDLRNITDESNTSTDGAPGVMPPYDWYLYDSN